MLPGCSFNACTSSLQAIYFRFALLLVNIIEIITNITIGCLFSNGCQGSCAKHVILAKQFFSIGVGTTLIITGKIQVYVRNFVPLKAQKDFKRNIKAIFFKFGATFWTNCIRHVYPSTILARFIKLAILTIWATIMCRQRINFRDIRKIRHNRRTYRTTRTNNVAIIIGIFYKFVGNQIEHCIAVTNDRFKFLIYALLNEFRQRIAI